MLPRATVECQQQFFSLNVGTNTSGDQSTACKLCCAYPLTVYQSLLSRFKSS
ncbi:MAG: hypothetical protein ACRCZB_07420 [Bacteroidales bacterium]